VVMFVITDGERRWRAIGWLIRNGHEFYRDGSRIDKVEVEPNPGDYTEWDRLRQQHTTNNNKKYTVLENAEMCYRKKNFFLKHKEKEHFYLAPHEIPDKDKDLYGPISNTD